MHALANYGWDLRDALDRTATTCETALRSPEGNFLNQIIENKQSSAPGVAGVVRGDRYRATYWSWTVFDAAEELGRATRATRPRPHRDPLVIQSRRRRCGSGAVTELRLTLRGGTRF